MLAFAAFPPLRLGLIIFVAFVPWLQYLRTCDGKRAFRSGLAFGFLFWMGEFAFMAQFVGTWTRSWVMGAVPYLLGCAIACFYFGLFGWLAGIAYRRSIGWTVPILWAGVEVFRSYVIGIAFPYALIASPLTHLQPIIQSAHFGSIFLVSGWVFLCNFIVAELMSGARYQQVRWYVAVFGIILVGSLFRYSEPQKGEVKTLVAGQTGVNMAFGDQTMTEQKIAANANDIIGEARGADLLVLPEGIARAGDEEIPPLLFNLPPDLPLVFGGQRGVKPKIYQSAFFYDGKWTVADKTRLVIFGEYVPMRQYLPFLDNFELPNGDLSPGADLVTPKVGQFRVGTAICFEALFPDIAYRHARNGANVLAVMSVDDWYLGSTAPEQLRDASIWRAIESGLPTVRAASLGLTDIIDARGEIVAEAPLGRPYTLSARVRVPEKADLFPLLPVFPYAAVLSLLAVPIYDFILRRRLARDGDRGK